jgi:hypothetical protein
MLLIITKLLKNLINWIQHYDNIYYCHSFISIGICFYGKFVESIFKPDANRATLPTLTQME